MGRWGRMLRSIRPHRPIAPIPQARLIILHCEEIIGRSAAKSNARAQTRRLTGNDDLADSLGLCLPHEVDARRKTAHVIRAGMQG